MLVQCIALSVSLLVTTYTMGSFGTYEKFKLNNDNVTSSPNSQHINDYLHKLTESVTFNVEDLKQLPNVARCECAVFNTVTPNETDKAILTQGPINVSCDDSGEEDCKKLCAALAIAAKEHGSELLCTSVGHYDYLQASVHSRVCGMGKWTYTGLTSPDEICCHDSRVIDCNNMPPTNPNQL